jgi:iron(III) transport system ATP-binding protein
VGDAEFIPGEGRGDVVRTDLGTLELVAPLWGAGDVLVRPEDVRLDKDPDGDTVVVSREFFGHDQLLSLRTATGRTLRARLGSVTDLNPGDRCRVRIPVPVRAYPRPPTLPAGRSRLAERPTTGGSGDLRYSGPW